MNLVKKILMALILVVGLNSVLSARQELGLRCEGINNPNVKYYTILLGWIGDNSIIISEITRGNHRHNIYSDDNYFPPLSITAIDVAADIGYIFQIMNNNIILYTVSSSPEDIQRYECNTVPLMTISNELNTDFK